MSVTGERLEQALRRRDWEQSDLADRLGITQGTISKIIRGRTSNSRWLPRMASELGVSLEWLQGLEDEPRGAGGQIALAAEEQNLLDWFRSMAPKDRAAVMQIVRTIATSAASPKIHDKQLTYRGEQQ